MSNKICSLPDCNKEINPNIFFANVGYNDDVPMYRGPQYFFCSESHMELVKPAKNILPPKDTKSVFFLHIITIKEQEYLKKIKLLVGDGFKKDQSHHLKLDNLIMELLTDMGFNKLILEYDSFPKWYE